MEEGRRRDRYNVEAVERFVRICEFFNPGRTSLTLSEIAHLAEIPVRTAGKIVATLEAHDLLSREGGKYKLGFAWLRLGQLKRGSLDIREFAIPVMTRLRDEINETVLLSKKIGDLRVNIENVESTHAFRRIIGRGSEMPIHVGASGRTLLAGLTDAEISAYLSRVKLVNHGHDTPTNAKRIWDDIRKIREQGFLSSAREIQPDNFSISAPIKDFAGKTLAVLTIVGPLIRLTPALQKRYAALLVQATKDVLPTNTNQ